jgi:hypothetical protein
MHELTSAGAIVAAGHYPKLLSLRAAAGGPLGSIGLVRLLGNPRAHIAVTEMALIDGMASSTSTTTSSHWFFKTVHALAKCVIFYFAMPWLIHHGALTFLTHRMTSN